MTQTIRIIGIDPGTINVGYGVVEKRGSRVVHLASGCIVSRDRLIADRLVAIYRGLRAVMDAHSPRAAAVETVFSGNNPKTAIAIGEGRGVAVLSAAERGIEVKGYEPALIKRAIAGSGRAGKDQVRNMVRILLALPGMPETDHESDALALAITHAKHMDQASRFGERRAAPPFGKKLRRSLPDLVLRQIPAESLSRAGRR